MNNRLALWAALATALCFAVGFWTSSTGAGAAGLERWAVAAAKEFDPPPIPDVSPTPSTCNSDTCPDGCCDGDGNCRYGYDNDACGPTGGGLCADCTRSGQFCSGTECVDCNVDHCSGCCDDSGACQGGYDNTACGSGGESCADCLTNQHFCNAGTCELCSANTCSSGCCDASGLCRTGYDNDACGGIVPDDKRDPGAACVDCTVNQETCYNGECQPCNYTTCNYGCCDASGACQDGYTSDACGGPLGRLDDDAWVCVDCTASDEWCYERQCVSGTCGPDNCQGCCDCDGVCQRGESADACGYGGAACAICSEGNICGDGACRDHCVDCTTGCCNGVQCLPGTDNNACGSGGDACVVCCEGYYCDADGICAPDDDDDNDDNDDNDNDDNDNDDNDDNDNDNDDNDDNDNDNDDNDNDDNDNDDNDTTPHHGISIGNAGGAGCSF